MAEKLTVKPAEGLVIPNPATGRDLGPEGETVGSTVYWRRRIREGAVTVVGAGFDDTPTITDKKGK